MSATEDRSTAELVRALSEQSSRLAQMEVELRESGALREGQEDRGRGRRLRSRGRRRPLHGRSAQSPPRSSPCPKPWTRGSLRSSSRSPLVPSPASLRSPARRASRPAPRPCRSARSIRPSGTSRPPRSEPGKDEHEQGIQGKASRAEPRTGRPQEIAADIEATREELGDTVEALAAKTDVKARAKEKVAETKESISEKVSDIGGSAREATPDSASAGAQQAAAAIKENPEYAALAGAFAGRRHRRLDRARPLGLRATRLRGPC